RYLYKQVTTSSV
ncbi:hypothetical protein VCHENC02_2321, partial [Vibrio harveyi]